jgi:phenylacetate-CoA ligase
MLQVRGVNIYPASVESLILAEAEVSEFQIEVFERRSMWEMRAAIEVSESSAAEEVKARVEKALSRNLGLRAEVQVAPPGSLPRFELKARRFRIRRGGLQNET